MSPRIHQLPEDLVARIAAGEVVERPASLLKELIENGLDAGAKNLFIEIEGAGRTLISVSDDGCGMTKEDAHLSLKRHATSKIFTLEDLGQITTFGFRGEALPSIAAVSRLSLTTRIPEEEIGWELVLEGGKLISEKPVARESGTTLSVRDIFFNTPARFKFLKSDPTERSQCLRVLEEMVFTAPQVGFQVKLEKAKPLHFQALNSTSSEDHLSFLKTRVSEAWGSRWAYGLKGVNQRTDHFVVTGVVTSSEFHQPTPRYQFLFINHRPVQNRRLTRAIYDAYRGQLPSIRHPGWVLFLEVNPQSVDVNVHPSKREVKLTHESEIFMFLSMAVSKSLTQQENSASNFLSRRPEYPTLPSTRAPLIGPTAIKASMELLGPRVLESRPGHKTSPETPSLELEQTNLQVLAQIRKTFILAQTREGVLILDQHAAAEKVLYEQLYANLKAKTPQTQMLLIPFSWEVALSMVPSVTANLSVMKALGFMIEPFGGSTFVVKGYPYHLGEKFDLHSLLDGLIDVFTESKDPKGGLERNIEHRLAAMTACKASVKAGDPLDLKACETIVRQLFQCQAPMTCPHGRPTLFRLSFSELEHRFRRT